jgi:hypothetical protein
MSGVGAVGAGGAAGAPAAGAGGAAGAPAAGAAGGASGVTSDGGGVTPTSGGKDNSSELSAGVPPPGQSNMSTQDFMMLHQSSVMQTSPSSCVENETQANGPDLNKLMEWMIAIKLLEAMNKGG